MKVIISFDEMCIAIREYVNREYKNYRTKKNDSITIYYNARDTGKFRAEVEVDKIKPKVEDIHIPEKADD